MSPTNGSKFTTRPRVGLLAGLTLLATLAWSAGSSGQEIADQPTLKAQVRFPYDRGAADRAGAINKEELAERYPKAVRKLRGRLLELVDRRERLGQADAAAYAAANLLRVADDQVTVIIVPAQGGDPKASTYGPPLHPPTN